MSLKPEDPYVITTIERHILEEQHHFPEATGVLTAALRYRLAGKDLRQPGRPGGNPWSHG
jgi:hypothetical protein